MSSQILQDCKLFVAHADLTGYMNALALTYSAEMRDATTFGNDTRINKGGLKSISAQHEGLWDADGSDEPDDVFFGRVGTQNVPVTICPTDGTAGEIAFLFRAVHSEYTPGGSVGDLFAFSVSMEGSDGAPLVRGKVLHTDTEVETGTSAGLLIGAASAAQTIYGALHVLAVDGESPTLDVIVQSDVDDNWSSPITKLTFAQQTTTGSDWQTLAGANPDTWYRLSMTLGGTDQSFTFIAAFGIA